MKRKLFAAAATAAAALAIAAPGTASADYGRYTMCGFSRCESFDYTWYRDLPADIHREGLRSFGNNTPVDMCGAKWDRGNLYRVQVFPAWYGHVKSNGGIDAIVDCRYFLA